MKCPECGAWSVILETRDTSVRYRRRRECANGHKFTTEEIALSQKQLKEEQISRAKEARKSRKAVI
jgi:transcriptional regulator NrdR family protein